MGFPHLWKRLEEGTRERNPQSQQRRFGGAYHPKDLDEKERQLEEQQNRVQSLSTVLAKQQNVWNRDMDAKQTTTLPKHSGAFCESALTQSVEIL